MLCGNVTLIFITGNTFTFVLFWHIYAIVNLYIKFISMYTPFLWWFILCKKLHFSNVSSLRHILSVSYYSTFRFRQPFWSFSYSPMQPSFSGIEKLIDYQCFTLYKPLTQSAVVVFFVLTNSMFVLFMLRSKNKYFMISLRTILFFVLLY